MHAPGGAELLAAFAAAAAHLEASAKGIDAINVYPVPDGDTGSNMAATLRYAVDSAQVHECDEAATVLAAIARGALYGARGNSGVILSQGLRGLADGAKGAAVLDGWALAHALGAAASAAYGAVAQPVEGTMLTVLRAAAESAMAAATSPDAAGCVAVLAAAVEAAEKAEARTIEQLPALREAGVTDSGGEGVCVILRGLLAALRGEGPPPVLVTGGVPLAQIQGHAREAFGFCTEFVLEPGNSALDPEAVRAFANRPGNRSVVVIGDATAMRVHVHSDEPQRVLADAAAFGAVSHTKAEDMSRQHERFRETGSGAHVALAVLALSRGEGFDRLFRDLGAVVADLGEVVKPPAGEIASSADAAGAADVIVLPNHKNVLLAAQQAASLASCRLHVVATESLPQGLSACLAFDPARPLAENAAAMEEARHGVRTVEVTRAAADRTVDGVAVRTGDAIAVVDGRLRGAGANEIEVLLRGLGHAGAAGAGLITVYTGARFAGTEALAARIEDAFAGVEVEVHEGGQPLYTLIAGVEA